jgi:hypothetical protein
LKLHGDAASRFGILVDELDALECESLSDTYIVVARGHGKCAEYHNDEVNRLAGHKKTPLSDHPSLTGKEVVSTTVEESRVYINFNDDTVLEIDADVDEDNNVYINTSVH